MQTTMYALGILSGLALIGIAYAIAETSRMRNEFNQLRKNMLATQEESIAKLENLAKSLEKIEDQSIRRTSALADTHDSDISYVYRFIDKKTAEILRDAEKLATTAAPKTTANLPKKASAAKQINS